MGGAAAATDAAHVARPRTVIGLERGGLVATGIVAAIVLVYAAVLPVIGAALPEPDTTVKPGSGVTLAGRARFVPASDWVVEKSSDPERGSYLLTHDGVILAIAVEPRDDTAAQILADLKDQVEKNVTNVRFGDSQTVQTNSGLVGVGTAFLSPDREGALVAFADAGTGVGVFIAGGVGTVSIEQPALDEMVLSIEVTQ